MKKVFLILSALVMVCSVAVAEEIDISNLSFAELVSLEERVKEAKEKFISDLVDQYVYGQENAEPISLDVSVDSVRIQNNSAGTPLVFVVLKNTSSTLTIDRVDFNVKCYDAYGDLIKIYDRYSYSECFYDDSVLKPGAKSPSSYRWTFYGAEGAKEVEVAIVKYHATDGTTVTVPDSQIEWIRF